MVVLNFSWLVPGILAGFAHPGGAGYRADGDQSILRQALQVLREQGLGAMISLVQEPLDQQALEENGFEHLWLPIPDMAPPGATDIDAFVDFVDDATAREVAVGVHCLAGLGRTGTMLACYLVSKSEDPHDAIARVRLERPGSIETSLQESVVHEYARRTREALNTEL